MMGLLFNPNLAWTADLRDWPGKIAIEPEPVSATPVPQVDNIAIEYRCGVLGGPCDLAEFM